MGYMSEAEEELAQAREASRAAQAAYQAAIDAANEADRARYDAYRRYSAAVHARFAEVAGPLIEDARRLTERSLRVGFNSMNCSTPLIDAIALSLPSEPKAE